MLKVLIRLKYLIKGAGLGLLDGTLLSLYWHLHLLGFGLIALGFGYDMQPLAIYPHNPLAIFWHSLLRLPASYAIGCVGWTLVLFGKLLRTPQGWRGTNWKDFGSACLQWGSYNANRHLEETARRIDLETRLRQENLSLVLSEQQRREIEEASKSGAATKAYRRFIAANRPGRPHYSYLTALAVVLAGMLFSSSASAGEVTHVKQASKSASMARTATCHPPPAYHANGTTFTHPTALIDQHCLSPASPEVSMLVLIQRLARRYWQYLRSMPEPPVLAIDHVPISSAQFQQLVVA